MDCTKKFYFEEIYDHDLVSKLIVIGFNSPEECFKNMECIIAPEYGSNLCRFIVDGNAIIDFDKELLKQKDYTGTPVLYPTPNRVRNGVFTFKGKIFNQVKKMNQFLNTG